MRRLVVEVAGTDELLAERLWALGAIAIEERPDSLVAGFADDDAARAAATTLASARLVEVDDAVWRDAWKPHAAPFSVGRLRIAPAWADDGTANVVIDPRDAFGYDHATTRMMLAAIDELVDEATTVLDVGSGSGIVAVAASVLGARRAVAIDVDEHAVATTIENAERNHVADRVHATATPLDELDDRFDLVVANLGGTQVVVDLAAHLCARLAPGGRLVIGGVLSGAHGPLDDVLDVLRVDDDGSWCAIRAAGRRS